MSLSKWTAPGSGNNYASVAATKKQRTVDLVNIMPLGEHEQYEEEDENAFEKSYGKRVDMYVDMGESAAPRGCDYRTSPKKKKSTTRGSVALMSSVYI